MLLPIIDIFEMAWHIDSRGLVLPATKINPGVSMTGIQERTGN